MWVNVGPLRDPRLSSKMILPLVFPLAVYESSISLVSLLGVVRLVFLNVNPVGTRVAVSHRGIGAFPSCARC